MECMVATSAVRALIRDDKAHQLLSIIQTGGKYGMKTMNQSVYDLYKRHTVNFDDAISHSSNPEEFKKLCQREGRF